jgi:hypothetical protein
MPAKGSGRSGESFERHSEQFGSEVLQPIVGRALRLFVAANRQDFGSGLIVAE